MDVSFVSTTEAAFLLNISTGRLRFLLNSGRVVGAKKVKRLWRIPLNQKKMPEIIPGRRGPEPTWIDTPCSKETGIIDSMTHHHLAGENQHSPEDVSPQA